MALCIAMPTGSYTASTPQVRPDLRGLWLRSGPTLSAGQPSPGAALQALFASAQHAAILLEGSSVAVGVGYFYSPASYYQHYWVVMTGNP